MIIIKVPSNLILSLSLYIKEIYLKKSGHYNVFSSGDPFKQRDTTRNVRMQFNISSDSNPLTACLILVNILLVHHEYKAAVVFDDNANEIHDIVNIIAKQFLPIFVYNFSKNSIEIFRNTPDEIFLHIFRIETPARIEWIQIFQDNIFPYDHLFIWLMFDNESFVLNSVAVIESFPFIKCKVLMFTKSGKLYSINRNGHAKINGLEIGQTSDESLLQLITYKFNSNFVNLHGSELIIFFNMFPPNNNILEVDERLLLIGQDGFIAASITEKLNATPYICTDVELVDDDFRDFFDPINQKTFNNVLTPLVIDSIQYNSSKFDLQMTTLLKQTDVDLIHNRLHTDSLYPHTFSCLYVVVPRNMKTSTFLAKMLENRSIHMILYIFLIFGLIRILFKRASYQQWFDEFLGTAAIYMAQNSMKITNNTQLWEKMWLVALLAFAVMTTALLASTLYSILIDDDNLNQIDTVAELLETNLTIAYPLIQEAALAPWLKIKYVLFLFLY